MRYEGNIYRPPSEARSLIIQATIGCAHNTCTFCSMFKDKTFRIRPIEEVLADITEAKSYYQGVKKVFLADGDALILKTEDLVRILKHIKAELPSCERIGIYATPQDINRKSLDELKTLKENGLGIAYIGVESGSAAVLKAIKKGVTVAEIVEAGKKIKASGIQSSVTLISGLGGVDNWREHAVESGKIIDAIDPDYVGLLTLMLEPGTELYQDIQKGAFQVLSPEEVMVETKEMLENIKTATCVFRSNHASNYLSLKGDLQRDKQKLIKQIEHAMENSGVLKDERFRLL